MNVILLRQCFQKVMKIYPFKIDAFVILPDHMHFIWTLPDEESDYSMRWRLIKFRFSRLYSGYRVRDLSESKIRKKEKGIWQRRFWEHLIRDEQDFNRHCDYIHYNPVKHGLVISPGEWKNSSFEKYIQKGIYSKDWGHNPEKSLSGMNFE